MDENVALEDVDLRCRDCGRVFVFSIEEQAYHLARGWNTPPLRCPQCRAARKATEASLYGQGVRP